MKKLFGIGLLLISAMALCAQQPQSQHAPIYPINAKYANGVAPGYWPTAGSGLTLNLSAGTANCAGTIVTYAGGTLSMTASIENYVYLNTSASCAPAVKTTAFTSSDIPIATVVAGTSAITSIADDRTMFQESVTGGGGSSGVSQIIAGTNVTISPSGGTGAVTVNAGGGSGGNSVSYNPSTTMYYLASSSILLDDNHNISSAVAAGAWSCSAGVCTVNTTSAHGYQTGDWVCVNQLTGWPSDSQTRTYVSIFPITVTSTTQFTFSSTNTGSGSGGNLYLSTYWGAYETANQPFIKGHGTYTHFFTTAANLATNFSSLVNCSAGTPSYLILEVGLNDIISNSQTAGQVETSLQSIWQQAHAAGCVVVEGSLLNTQIGIDSSSYWSTVGQINEWMAEQGPTGSNRSNGQFWDRYIDFNAYGGLSGRVGTDPSGSAIFAQRVNEAFASQGSSMSGPPPVWQPWTNNSLAFNIPEPYPGFVMLDGYNPAVLFSTIGTYDGGKPRIEVHAPNTAYGNGEAVDQLFDFGFGTNMYGCSRMGNSNESVGDDSFRICYTQVSLSSLNNYWSLQSNYTNYNSWNTWIKVFMNGAIQFPLLVASSGTQPLVVDTSGNVSVGTNSSGLSGMTAGQVPIAATASTVTSSKPLAGSGAGIVTGPISSTTAGDIVTYADAYGTMQDGGAAPVASVTGTSPIVATKTGSTVAISCPTCSVSSGGTAVSINGGTALGSLNLTGSIPITCSDTSGSGTAQSCTTTPSFTPTAGNCITYLTTTANSGTALTINVNSSAADSVAKWAGSATTLAAGDIPANKPVPMCFDAAGNWDVMTIGNAPSGGSISSQYKTFSCEPGLGDGTNAITAATYHQTTCYNNSGATWTITAIECYTDNSGSSTIAVADNSSNNLLSASTLTCSATPASGTVNSSHYTISNGGWIKFTFVADGATTQTTWIISGTY